MTVPAKPERPCYACGETNWWYRAAYMFEGKPIPGDWVCARCHPSLDPNYKDPPHPASPEAKPRLVRAKAPLPAPEAAKEVIPANFARVALQAGAPDTELARFYREASEMTLEALKARVVKANDLLIDKWVEIKAIRNTDEWEKAWDNFAAAAKRANRLCDILVKKGFTDCLYILPGGVRSKSCLSQVGDRMCWCCPSAIKYWEAELFGSVPGRVERKVDEQTLSFFKSDWNEI